MFYVDDDEVTVLQLGTGDTRVCAGLLRDLETGSVVFVDNCGFCNPIGEKDYNGWEMGTLDNELNTVMRIVFTDPASIDSLIRTLQEAKELMEDPTSHPGWDKIKKRADYE